MDNRENSTVEDEQLETSKYDKILDEILKLDKRQQTPDIFKLAISITASIATLMLVILLCASIYKNNFSVESIISVLLAFFSIFMAVFFYFKADETSTKFYINSYDFMKDISITLGKIEERFGEKLNNLYEKLSHIEGEKVETEKSYARVESKKETMVDEIIELLPSAEKEKYLAKIKELNDESEKLKRIIENKEKQYNDQVNKLIKSKNNNENELRSIYKARRFAGNNHDEILRWRAENEVLNMDEKTMNYLIKGKTGMLSRDEKEEFFNAGILDMDLNLTEHGKKCIEKKMNMERML